MRFSYVIRLFQKNGVKFILGGGILLIIFSFLLLFKDCMIDDAYITLTYSKNLFEHYHWGLNRFIISNTATSPINVILTGLVGKFIFNYEYSPIFISALEFFALLIILYKLSLNLNSNKIIPFLIFPYVIFNLLILSSIGLESILYITLFTVCIYFNQKKYVTRLGLFLGLLTLTRPDGILLFIAIILFGEKHTSKNSFRKLGEKFSHTNSYRISVIKYFLIITIPWYLISWIFLYSIIPETFFIKVHSSWDEHMTFFNGYGLYIYKFPLEVLSSIITLPILFYLVVRNGFRFSTNEKIILCYVFLYIIGYSLLMVPPYHWYYIPVIYSFILILYFQIIEFDNAASLNKKYYVLPVIPFLFILIFFLKNGELILSEAPMHTNWATKADYKKVAMWLNSNIDSKREILTNAEIGTLSFYSNIPLINEFSSSIYLTNNILKRIRNKNTFTKYLVKINFFWFHSTDTKDKPTYYLQEFRNSLKTLPAETIKSWMFKSKWVNCSKLYLTNYEN